MVGLFFGAVVLHVIVGYIQNIIVGRIAEHILIDLRRAMYEHLQRVSMSFMDKTEVGRMMSRLQGDVAALQEFLETAVVSIGDFLLLFGIVIAMLIMDWRLALLTFAVVSTLAIARAVWLPIARRAFIYSRQTASITSGALAENINGVRVVQGMSREHVNLDLFKEKADEQLWASKRAARIGLVMIAMVDTLSGAAMAIIIVVGGNMVIGNSLEIGSMLAFILYVQLFFDPIRSITMHYAVFQRAMASGERIFEVLDVPIDIQDKDDAKPLVENDGSVEFKDVTFGYLEDEPILKNINFRVEPGETVALVGPTGSGKTSITSLLHRFYDIWEGEILISRQRRPRRTNSAAWATTSAWSSKSRTFSRARSSKTSDTTNSMPPGKKWWPQHEPLAPTNSSCDFPTATTLNSSSAVETSHSGSANSYPLPEQSSQTPRS